MSVRENKVETYFKDQIKALGGITRKWVSPGVDGVPDQIVIMKGGIFFAEIKTSDGKKSPAQLREQARLQKNGALVITLYGEKDVDRFIKYLEKYNK